jgi:hypothetical protein
MNASVLAMTASSISAARVAKLGQFSGATDIGVSTRKVGSPILVSAASFAAVCIQRIGQDAYLPSRYTQ